ncbi:MAG TPA: hypothetical protein VGQ12_12815 [Candidatus Angelobacter sp.]|jgi:hypothetical protein|nr:hypothetical protein [Candidatus Angelobacter sp.]
MKTSVLCSAMISLSVLSTGCGGTSSNNCIITANITPASAIGDHSSSPANLVQFSTTGSASGNCPMRPDTVGTWSTSDPGNTSISNQAGTVGLATCLGTTTTPAAISNSGTIRGKGFTSATLTCR